MTGNLKLWVPFEWDVVDEHTGEHLGRKLDYREATTAELVGVVRHLPNVEEVRRCVRHWADAWEPGDYCRPAWPDDIDDCVLISVLVVPLGGDDT